MGDLTDFIAVLETWAIRRETIFNEPGMKYNSGSNYASMQRFVETQDALTRKMISILGRQDPLFYSAMYELAQNTDRIIKGGKTFINGQQQK